MAVVSCLHLMYTFILALPSVLKSPTLGLTCCKLLASYTHRQSLLNAYNPVRNKKNPNSSETFLTFLPFFLLPIAVCCGSKLPWGKTIMFPFTIKFHFSYFLIICPLPRPLLIRDIFLSFTPSFIFKKKSLITFTSVRRIQLIINSILLLVDLTGILFIRLTWQQQKTQNKQIYCV